MISLGYPPVAYQYIEMSKTELKFQVWLSLWMIFQLNFSVWKQFALLLRNDFLWTFTLQYWVDNLWHLVLIILAIVCLIKLSPLLLRNDWHRQGLDRRGGIIHGNSSAITMLLQAGFLHLCIHKVRREKLCCIYSAITQIKTILHTIEKLFIHAT